MNPEFDPNGPGIPGNFFGLPFTIDEARLVILPVPWDVTVSYHEGTSRGPQAIKKASLQVDLHLNTIKDAWNAGLFDLDPIQESIEENDEVRAIAREYIYWLENGSNEGNMKYQHSNLDQINLATQKLVLERVPNFGGNAQLWCLPYLGGGGGG